MVRISEQFLEHVSTLNTSVLSIKLDSDLHLHQYFPHTPLLLQASL